ncbi:unnamed protein product [Rotaria sp. Silwood2]|nr:unnamed protein product [Rotaria sp. Silwood2]CAF4189350.1 unnamed protein product [Rotaria sp. Silwood2]CAF4219957.1 unnamed protein product [Rotaria sp. Silwood2]
MEESIDNHPAKQMRTTDEQNFHSTFECLSGELILKVFEYFNTKEIFQSFSNLNSLITSCIFDQRQQLHVHFDHEMCYFPEKYSPSQVISLHMNNIIIPIGIFHNLKSLSIVYRNEQNDECLQMINEVYIPDDPSDVNNGSPNFKFQDRKISLNFTRQYDVRHLDLQFQCWKLQSLVKILSAMPLLITLKIKGHCCCNEVYGWLYLDDWDKMLQNLKALQQVDIDICLAIPFSLRQKITFEFPPRLRNLVPENLCSRRQINAK